MAAAGAIYKGSMPAFYDRYLGPIQFAPWAGETAARVAKRAPARLLETACGTGIVTYAMADASPRTEIVATDFGQDMLDFAASKRQGAKIEWKQVDAQELPFADASFDMLVCQFGVMFFPDKAKAYSEARRVLKPGGCFLFTVWDRFEHNELPRISSAAIGELFPNDRPTFMERVPYGYNDTQAIERALRASGFARVEAEILTRRVRATARDQAIGACQGGPLRNEIEARDPDGLERATEAVTRALEEEYGNGEFEAKNQAIFITAEV
jgi:ubiquinone/menaquinone biosynthesis C-methylase UbiE